jgi:hypothetical protein
MSKAQRLRKTGSACPASERAAIVKEAAAPTRSQLKGAGTKRSSAHSSAKPANAAVPTYQDQKRAERARDEIAVAPVEKPFKEGHVVPHPHGRVQTVRRLPEEEIEEQSDKARAHIENSPSNPFILRSALAPFKKASHLMPIDGAR